jgi:hypothetical protein
VNATDLDLDVKAVAQRLLDAGDLTPADSLIVTVIARTGADRTLSQWLAGLAVESYGRKRV